MQQDAKPCTKCKEVKPLTEFRKNRNYKDGLTYWCKSCHKLYMETYQESPNGKIAIARHQQSEKAKATRVRYYQTNKERCKAYQFCYRQTDKFKAALARYRQTDKGRATLAAMKQQHPERFKAREAVNIAVRAGRLPQPTTLQCSYCDNAAHNWHHSQGYEPEHWLDVVPACRSCDQQWHRDKETA